MEIKKVLVANRGEIAIRVMRACQELDIKTVAVYSNADQKSLHLQFADECVYIGESPPIESYLNIDLLIKKTKEVGADAIHPGYGFLAENQEFARKCEQTGIIFVGPSSETLKLVGDKVESRATVSKVGVPIIPGMHAPGKQIEEFKNVAKETGYPVIIKASMGGGGKGMRIVNNEKELADAISASKREAKSAFGDETVYLEKYIEQPRHIEFQILSDNYGNIIHLYERECSIQRRYQKIIEETPSRALDTELRDKMSSAAKKVMEASHYKNAGTVEFLLDKNKNFYFMEVNARIQVEHPITELVTGVDLVKQQLLIASGKKLTLKQTDIKQRGHAIEARIYAEDPTNNFLPSPGKILFLKEPQGPGIRIDSGIYSGWTVPTYYDPILSKLIAFGETREFTIKRLIQALKNYVILGIRPGIDFLIDILEHPDFIEGKTYTDFIARNFNNWKPDKSNITSAIIASAIAELKPKLEASEQPEHRKIKKTPWQEIGEWEICKA